MFRQLLCQLEFTTINNEDRFYWLTFSVDCLTMREFERLQVVCVPLDSASCLINKARYILEEVYLSIDSPMLNFLQAFREIIAT